MIFDVRWSARMPIMNGSLFDLCLAMETNKSENIILIKCLSECPSIVNRMSLSMENRSEAKTSSFEKFK